MCAPGEVCLPEPPSRCSAAESPQLNLGVRPHYASMSDLIPRLQEWYASQCDGDWEHSEGVEIGTVDNPGWSLRVSLVDTPLEGVSFEEVKELASETDWIHCIVRENRWEGYGDPRRLEELLRRFLDWAEPVSRPAV